MNEKIECQKCFWTGGYDDLIAPTSDHEPSCPECLSDDFLEVEDIIPDSEEDGTQKYFREFVELENRREEMRTLTVANR